jgi:hypothetical protein
VISRRFGVDDGRDIRDILCFSMPCTTKKVHALREGITDDRANEEIFFR